MAVNFKKEIAGTVDSVIPKVTEALKTGGFGILTRIDLHEKFKEKLGKEIAPAVILGACNPQFAYQFYQINTDIASLMPCNAVVRQIAPNKVSVELLKPSSMVESIGGDKTLMEMAREIDQSLSRILETL